MLKGANLVFHFSMMTSYKQRVWKIQHKIISYVSLCFNHSTLGSSLKRKTCVKRSLTLIKTLAPHRSIVETVSLLMYIPVIPFVWDLTLYILFLFTSLDVLFSPHWVSHEFSLMFDNGPEKTCNALKRYVLSQCQTVNSGVLHECNHFLTKVEKYWTGMKWAGLGWEKSSVYQSGFNNIYRTRKKQTNWVFTYHNFLFFHLLLNAKILILDDSFWTQRNILRCIQSNVILLTFESSN